MRTVRKCRWLLATTMVLVWLNGCTSDVATIMDSAQKPSTVLSQFATDFVRQLLAAMLL